LMLTLMVRMICPNICSKILGPKYDPNLLVYDWESFDPSSPNYRQPKPWAAPENGPETFMKLLYLALRVY
jgi:hypothetical protein